MRLNVIYINYIELMHMSTPHIHTSKVWNEHESEHLIKMKRMWSTWMLQKFDSSSFIIVSHLTIHNHRAHKQKNHIFFLLVLHFSFPCHIHCLVFSDPNGVILNFKYSFIYPSLSAHSVVTMQPGFFFLIQCVCLFCFIIKCIQGDCVHWPFDQQTQFIRMNFLLE